MDMLDAPTVLHQFTSKPIEQLAMLCLGSFIPKIKDACNQRLPKMPTPYVIDGNACGKRIAFVGDPTSQSTSATCTCRTKL